MTRDAFTRVTLDSKDRVHGYAAWLLGDPEEARDVTQESLMRLWMNRERVAGAARTWLLTTAHRLCVDRRRRPGTVQSAGGAASGAAPAARTPEGGVVADERRTALAEALAALPLRDRAVLLLRETHGLSYEQISLVIGLPIGSMKAALHRARRRVRAALAPMMEVPR